jgi:hypothetical protein
MQVLEADLLNWCLNTGLEGSEFEHSSFWPDKLRKELGQQREAEIISTLCEILAEEKPEAVEFEEYATSTPNPLESRLGSIRGRDGKTVTYFIRIQDSLRASAVSLMGILVALHTGYLGAIVPALTALKNTWDNLVSLHETKDGDALTLLKTLAHLRANKSIKKPTDHKECFPTTAELLSECKLDEVSAMDAIKKLNGLGLIKCYAWGGQVGDLGGLDNRWSEKV